MSELLPPNLIHVSDEEPGYTRIYAGKKALYLDEQGSEIADRRVLDRIQQLVIPPQWQDTWICKLDNGHLQCTGRDDRQRKQYLYHPDWMEFRQQNKFARVAEFGQALPQLRARINTYLKSSGYPKEKVLAIAVKLLDLHYLRIGNDFYRNENDTYGLTTLRRKHLDREGDVLKLSYKAKSNKYRNISVTNRKLVKLLSEINELPGYEVFRYQESRDRIPIDSSDVNAFIRQLSHDQFSAKDFRTWGGTVSAVEAYPEALQEVAQNPRKQLEAAIVRRVAKRLGNTVATAREYYIHPSILNHLATKPPPESLTQASTEPFFKPTEATVLTILNHTTLLSS